VELQRDVLIVIFLKVRLMEAIRAAGSVCQSWQRVAKEEPDLWRRIDMRNHGYGCDAFLLRDPTLLAIDRSSVEYFGDDDLFQYLCEVISPFLFLFFIFSTNSNFEEEACTFILSFYAIGLVYD
jgi:F-box-like